jgi:hypothetical protein
LRKATPANLKKREIVASWVATQYRFADGSKFLGRTSGRKNIFMAEANLKMEAECTSETLTFT